MRPFLAGILTFKTLLQSAPEYAIFIQERERDTLFRTDPLAPVADSFAVAT